MNKPKRDITLGEMQDVCRENNGFCGNCIVSDVCPTYQNKAPCCIDLAELLGKVGVHGN